MNFIDLFAGIGGFRLALEQVGHKCIGFCEIDKFARQTYKANFDTEGEIEWHDITTVTDEQARELRGKVDLITAGFPCQAFSVAGHRRGFEDTRGTMFFEVARIAKQIEPRFLLFENVKGLLSHDKGKTFATILNTLDELGYDVEWQVLNSKNFGVPQNRERVFIVGHSRRFPRREIFPIAGSNGKALNQVGELDINDNERQRRVYGSDGISPNILARSDSPKVLINGCQSQKVYSTEGTSCTLSANGGGQGANTGLYAIPVLTPDRAEKRQNGRRFKNAGEPMFTLTSQDRHGVLVSQRTGIKEVEVSCTLDANYYKGLGSNQERTGVAIMRPKRTDYGKKIRKQYEAGEVEESRHNMTTLEPVFDGISNTITTVQKDNLLLDNRQCIRIRRLTPLECFRLQGFPDSHHDNAKVAGVSDSQLYKQAGNAVTVNVVYEIAKRLKEV